MLGSAVTLALGGGVVVAAPAAAATHVVLNANDDGTDGTLRYEIEHADVFDTITFDPTFFSVPRTITLNGNPVGFGEITIPTSVFIQGPGSGLLTVTRGDATDDYSIFGVGLYPGHQGVDIELSGMTIDAGTTTAQGSAFQSLTPDVDFLTFTDVVFRDQQAAHGAGVNIESATGNVSFYDCSFLFNHATGSGGGLATLGVAGTILLDNTYFLQNVAEDGAGGAVAVNPEDLETASEGDVIIQNGTAFETNDSETTGGAVHVNDVRHLIVEDATFTDNATIGTGGALFASDLTGNLSVTRGTFEQNDADHGGAMRFQGVGIVNIDASTFENNGASQGGALGLGMVADGYGPVTITNTRFAHNFAFNGYGGAIFTDGSSDAPFTIARSSFVENWAGAEVGDAVGGAMYVNGVTYPFTIDSTTFSKNSIDEERGVSVFVDNVSPGEEALLLIVNSTFDETQDGSDGTFVIAVNENAGNVAIKYSTIVGMIPFGIGGDEPGEQYIASTILQAHPAEVDIYADDVPVDVEYSILSGAHAPAYVADLGHNQFSTNALLGPLQDNGGPTQTRMPASNSPALSKGGPTEGAPLYDQRFEGFPRIVGALDVGAVEIPAVLPATGGAVPLPILGGSLLVLCVGAFMLSAAVMRRVRG